MIDEEETGQKTKIPLDRFQNASFADSKHPSHPRLNRFIPFFLALMLILTVLPLFYFPNPALYDWLNSPAVKSYYSLIVAAIYVVFACLIWAKNHAEIPLRYGLLFLWVLIFTLIIAFIHETSLAYVDANGISQTFVLPLLNRLCYETETFYNLFFCFAFLFLWSYAKEEPRYKNLVPYLMVLLALASGIYALIKGPDTSGSYLVYTGFFKSNEELGKVLFAGSFAAALLAFDHPDWRRYVFTGVAMGFVALAGVLALAITFWGLVMASFVAGIYVLLDQKAKSRTFNIGCLIYVLFVVVFVLLVAIPSPLATTLRVYFGNEIVALLSQRVALWGTYLNGLSSWRLLIGEGAIGYYRVSLSEGGEAAFLPLQNGVLDVFNRGGVVYLLFYFLLIIVGLFRFKKREEKNATFYAIVIAFTCAFLLFTIISDERLFFSSHFLSFFVAYVFFCYPHHKDPLIDEE